ncbi:MAG TPA: amino acid permease [Gemmatimonadales bacterium]|jgi:APA family basic amino acid/polyamine antiporter
MSLATRKSLDHLQAEAGKPTLRRALGPLNLTALGIGSVIGTGIFVLTGTAASQNAGPALVISMIIAAVACAFAGLCYAELASMIPVAGSAYTYAYASSGEFVAWIIGWDLILEYALSGATVAVGWSGYLVSFLRDVGIAFPPALTVAPNTTAVAADGSVVPGVFNLPAAAIVLLVTALLVIGIRQSANTNTALVALKTAVLILFVALGAAYVRKENLTPFIPPNTGEFGHFGVSGVFRGAAIMFFAYVGFDAVSTAAQEARNPQRDMPIGILASLFICTVIYIAVAIVLIGIVPYHRLNVADPIAIGIDATGLTWFSPVVKVSALFGLFSTILVQLLGQTRIFFSMSRDGLLPPLFGRVHPRFRTPHLSTLLTGSVMAVAAGLLPLGILSQLVSIGSLLAFLLVCIGVMVLRKTDPVAERPFRVPGVPWVPILGGVSCLAQMVSLPWSTWERLLVWLVLGWAIYFLYSRRHARDLRLARDAPTEVALTEA